MMSSSGTTGYVLSAVSTVLVAGWAINNPNWIVAAAAVVNVLINLALYYRGRKKQ